MSLFKAQAHARDLTQRLEMLIPGVTVAETYDANYFPILQVTHAGLSEWIYITTEYSAQSGAPVGSDPAGGSGPSPSNHVDGLGLPQRIYSPHQAQIYREASATNTDFSGTAQILAATALMGMKTLVWEGTGAGTAGSFSAAVTAASTFVTDVPSDYINPMTNSQ